MRLLSSLLVVAAAARNLHAGERVFRVSTPSTLVRDQLISLVVKDELDVWHSGEDFIDVHVERDFNEQNAFSSFNVTTIHEDLQPVVEKLFSEWVCTPNNETTCLGDDFYDTYQTLDVINARVARMIEDSDMISSLELGTSYEGRSIGGYVITSNNGKQDKLKAFYNCGIHAREWLPVPFCIWLGEYLDDQYGSVALPTDILDNFEIHIVPVLNVDGYVYTHTTDNNWRKSRMPNEGSSCVGTDLNRNLPFQWGTGGSSSDPCSNTFMGRAPLDNPETTLLNAYIRELQPIVYMDIHASGLMWLAPLGYRPRSSCQNDPRGCGVDSEADYNNYMASGEASRVAIQAVHGNNFRVGPITYIIYQASGATVDQMYSIHGVVYAYSPEVRAGFQPPVSNIIPSNEELYDGVLAQLQYAMENPGKRS